MEVLLGLVRLSVIVVPLPPCPPETLPASATVHTKLLGVLGVRGSVSRELLHTVVPALTNEGEGLTLTLTGVTPPMHEPAFEVGVTRY